MPGGSRAPSAPPARRRPPNEQRSTVVARRVAGCRPASAVTSRARRASMRRVRALAPTKSCSRQARKSSRCPTSLKKARRTSASRIGTSPGPSSARDPPARCAARRHEARKRNAPRVRWNSGTAAHRSRITSISAGWNGYDAVIRSRSASPSSSACRRSASLCAYAWRVRVNTCRHASAAAPAARGSGGAASSRRWMTFSISLPSTGSRRWSLRAARCSTVRSRLVYSSDSRLLDCNE